MPNKIIEVTISGGMIQDVSNLPENVEIHFLDYDIQEENERTEKDQDGDLFERIVY